MTNVPPNQRPRGSGWGPPPAPGWQQQAPYPQYPPPPQKPPGRVLSIIAFVLAGAALIFLPPFFMIAGVILSIIAINKGDSLGKWALGASIAGGVIGMVLGVLVLGLTD